MLLDGTIAPNPAHDASADFPRAARAFSDLAVANPPASEAAEVAGLAGIVDHLAGESRARGLLVLWHSSGSPPQFLASTGGAAKDLPRHQTFHIRAEAAAQKSLQSSIGGKTLFAEGPFHTVAIAFDNGVLTITALLGEIDSTAPARWRECLAMLLPVLKPFFAQWLATQQALGRIQSLQQAVQISDAAILMLGASAEIIYANSAAEKILAARDGLRRAGERLACSSFADTLRLQAALDQFKSQSGNEKGLSPVLALARAGRRPLTFALASALPSGCTLHDQVKAIAYVFDPEEDLTGIVEPACRLYHLSHRETKLTCALVEGMSLAEAAGRLGLQEQTARSYLKQIFSKTATKRQAELIQLMLKSAVRFASNGRTQAFA